MEYHELGIWLLLTLGTMVEGIEKIQRDVSHAGYRYQRPLIPLELPEEPHKHREHQPHEKPQDEKNEENEDEESVTSRTSQLEEDHSETHQDGRITNPPDNPLNYEHHHDTNHNNDITSYLPPDGWHLHHYLPPKNHSDHIQLETKPKPTQFLHKFEPNSNGKRKVKRHPDENLKNISDILKKINKNKYLSDV